MFCRNNTNGDTVGKKLTSWVQLLALPPSEHVEGPTNCQETKSKLVWKTWLSMLARLQIREAKFRQFFFRKATPSAQRTLNAKKTNLSFYACTVLNKISLCFFFIAPPAVNKDTKRAEGSGAAEIQELLQDTDTRGCQLRQQAAKHKEPLRHQQS